MVYINYILVFIILRSKFFSSCLTSKTWKTLLSVKLFFFF